jgi:hypothetical protein
MMIEYSDIDRFVSLASDGEEKATCVDFLTMESICEKHGSKVVTLIDAEGYTVCIAPEGIARRIAELINQDNGSGDQN